MSAHFSLIDYQFGTWNASFAIKRNKMDRRATCTNERLVMLSQQFWRILYNYIAIKRHTLNRLNQEVWIIIIKRSCECIHRAHYWFAPSQWETSLLCNDVSHLLGAIMLSWQSALLLHCTTDIIMFTVLLYKHVLTFQFKKYQELLKLSNQWIFLVQNHIVWS